MSTRNVLVAEDSPMMRQMLSVALEGLPAVSVHEAENGLEAIRLMARTQFDAFVTDINMPVMDGLKLIKHIRQDPRHASIPIVVITTESASVDKQRALALGANAYIRKPLQAHQVTTAISELLKMDSEQ
ncbi:MAG: response regulator [Polyangiales bacterium]